MAKDRKSALAAALRALPGADDPGLGAALAACRDLLADHDDTVGEPAALMCSAAAVLASVARSVGARLRVAPEKVMAVTYSYAEFTVHPTDCPHCEALRQAAEALEDDGRDVVSVSDLNGPYWRS